MDGVIDLFCYVDDFCQLVEPMIHQQLIEGQSKKRNRAPRLSVSEIMTIIIHFHQSHYRDFKYYYNHYVCNLEIGKISISDMHKTFLLHFFSTCKRTINVHPIPLYPSLIEKVI